MKKFHFPLERVLALRRTQAKVEEAKLGLWEQLYVPALIDGLKTTLGHMVKPKITEQYPEEEPKLPANYADFVIFNDKGIQLAPLLSVL